MKRIIRLTESDLFRLVKRVINEQETFNTNTQTNNEGDYKKNSFWEHAYHENEEEAKRLALQSLWNNPYLNREMTAGRIYDKTKVQYISKKLEGGRYKVIAFIPISNSKITEPISGSPSDPKFKELENKLRSVGFPFVKNGMSCGVANMVIYDFGSSIYTGGINTPSNKPKDIVTPYGLTINSTCGKNVFGFNLQTKTPEDKSTFQNFWNNLGYKPGNGVNYSLDINNTDNFIKDLTNFFKIYPPQKKGTEEPIKRPQITLKSKM
jgi:hypothetical protein